MYQVQLEEKACNTLSLQACLVGWYVGISYINQVRFDSIVLLQITIFTNMKCFLIKKN